MVDERTERTMQCLTNARRWTGPPAGKRRMVRAGGSASRTINDSDTPDPDGVIIWLGNHIVSQSWGASLRLKKIDAIVRFRIVIQLWWSGIRTWTRSGARSWRGAIGLLWGAMYARHDGECGRPESAGWRDGWLQ